MEIMVYLDYFCEKGQSMLIRTCKYETCMFAHAGQPRFYSLSIRLQLFFFFFCDLCKCNSYTQVQASEANLYGSVKFTQAIK